MSFALGAVFVRSNDDQTSKGASPEECDFEGVMRRLAAWRDAHEPGLQVWLTEFGYDTSSYSPNLAPAYGQYDAQEARGQAPPLTGQRDRRR